MVSQKQQLVISDIAAFVVDRAAVCIDHIHEYLYRVVHIDSLLLGLRVCTTQAMVVTDRSCLGVVLLEVKYASIVGAKNESIVESLHHYEGG